MLSQLSSPRKLHSLGHAFQAAEKTQSRSRCLVARIKPTKAAEFRSMSSEEIDSEIYNCQRALLDQRIAQSTRKTFKRDLFRWNKHKIAQLKTVLREREIEEGITPRESRRLEKHKNIAAGFPQY